jgi:hypothetical protein
VHHRTNFFCRQCPASQHPQRWTVVATLTHGFTKGHPARPDSGAPGQTRGVRPEQARKLQTRRNFLSTICVDKVVHNSPIANLSGLRKRLFCSCPQFELHFFIIKINILYVLQRRTV